MRVYEKIDKTKLAEMMGCNESDLGQVMGNNYKVVGGPKYV